MTYLPLARISLPGIVIASLVRVCLALVCLALVCLPAGMAAAGPAASGWSTEASPEPPKVTTNPVLCKSFEKGIRERLSTMRMLRFGTAKAPPLMPQDLTEWHRKTQMDPDVAKKYGVEEAMVRRLNGYMIDNGCQPVNIEAELGQGPVKPKAETR